MDRKPVNRKRNIIEGTAKVEKRGPGLGTGPVGNTGGRGRRDSATGGGNVQRSSSGSPLAIIVALVIALLGGGGSMLSNFSGQGEAPVTGENASMQTVDGTVAAGSREKYTVLKGNGQDQVTLMVYMCGTDLESKHGMATNDIREMLSADYGDRVNVVLYTGGCRQWQTGQISSDRNQIYQLKDHNLTLLEKDMGAKAMTDPATLTEFIKYCAGKFPADRKMLILWDHGGGSVSGYGYDEKFSGTSMDLSGIDRALSAAGEKFDFVGFDACLMATLENSLMLSKYADYMIASEETEPGVGWYYTNWLTSLGKNTSMATVDIGRQIVDDFVDTCARVTKGQKTTLSVVDLAEVSSTVPEKLSAFSAETAGRIKNREYQQIADARAGTREFAVSSKIDQVDLVDLADNMGTDAGAELAKAVKGAVKYNRASANMPRSYGLSIYFPARKLSRVDSAVKTYGAIGMDGEYTRCIQEYAKLQVAGQASSPGSPNAMGSLLGGALPSGLDYGSLIQMLSGAASSQLLGSITGGSAAFLTGRSVTDEEAADYVSAHSFDGSSLVWTKNDQGQSVIKLSSDEWKLITAVNMNKYIDDGEGYIDLGLDYRYELDGDDLVADEDNTWLTIGGRAVAFYVTSGEETDGGYTVTGYVPALLNGERVRLLMVFDDENESGYITGAEIDYRNGETELSAKNEDPLNEGDTLQFICDHYDYQGNYQDSYLMGDPVTYTDDIVIGDMDLGAAVTETTYMLTDIYGATHWSDPIRH